MRSAQRLAVLLAALLTGMGIACKDGTGPGKPKVIPQTVEKIAGDAQSAVRGNGVTSPLRVRVTGSDGQPFSGATVQWSFVNGTGTIAPAQSTTNASGEAEAQVTTLAALGSILVSATVPGVTPVIFSLTGLDPCDFSNATQILAGTTKTGTLASLDCVAHGNRLHDLYYFTLPSQDAVLMRLHSTSFDPSLQLYPPLFWYFVESDTVDATRNAKIKAILPAGGYGLAASSSDPDVTGSYELGLSTAPESAENCEFVLILAGIETTQSLASTDCPVATSANRYEDSFGLVIEAGETATVTETSTAFTPHLQLLRMGEVVAESDGGGTGTATVTFTSDVLAFYFVHASSAQDLQQGSYVLNVSSAGPSAAGTTGRTAAPGISLHRRISDDMKPVSSP